MDTNRLTHKSQEAVHDAQTKALGFGHTEVDSEHLLLALLDQPGGLVPRLLTEAGAQTDQLRTDLKEELGRRPRVSGPGAAPGQAFPTRRLARVLDRADYGARPLRRFITREVETRIGRALLAGDVHDGGVVRVFLEAGGLAVACENPAEAESAA